MKLKLMAAMTAAALGTLATSGPAHAMNIHVNGRQIILSGGVTTTDGYLFADTLARLKASGHTIDTVVLRNSPGGSTFSGYGIADIIRREGLATVASGYCISSCSIMFAGGTHRAFADNDQPFMLTDTTNDMGQFIGIHGVTVNNKYSPTYSAELKDYFVQALFNDSASSIDDPLFSDALSNHGASYARIWDPATGRHPSVYWCNPDCDNPSQYKAYPSDDARHSGFINANGPARTTDTLTVVQDMRGNINPNYFNPDIPGSTSPITSLAGVLASFGISNYGASAFRAGSSIDEYLASYASQSPQERYDELSRIFINSYVDNYGRQNVLAMLNDPTSALSRQLKTIANGVGNPLIDRSSFSAGDAYGIIHVTQGATWSLPQGSYGASDTLIIDHGRLRLDGGELNTLYTYVGPQGRLEGNGHVGNVYSNNTDSPQLAFGHGAILHPTGAGIELAGYVPPTANDNGSTATISLGDAALALDVRPDQRQGSLRFESVITPDQVRDYNGPYHFWYGGHLNVSPRSVLVLNVAPGFYASSQPVPLVTPDIGAWLDWLKRTAPADFQSLSPERIASYRNTLLKKGNYVSGSFNHLVRGDADGNPAGSYDVDPTTGTAFHPFDDSLISYGLVQNAAGLWLKPNDAFKGQPAFCGRDGCGLGDTLSLASSRPDTPLAPLLGALQFSTATQASHAAGQIRGEGYAALRTASLNLLGDFSGTLDQHVRAVSPGSDDGATAAFMNGAAGMGLDGTRRGTDVASMMRYLVAPDEVAGGSNTGHTNVWGRLFGSKGRLDAQDDAAGLRERTTGVMLGVDVPLKDNVVIGGSLGYGKLRANDSGSAFQGRVRALDARFYADYRYDGGYLDAALGVTRLRQTANRGIDLPLYAVRGTSRDAGNAWSLHLEHGLTLRDRHDIVWQPILPSLDMVRLPENRYSDKGLGVAGLDVRAKSTTDTRLGVGVQVYKVFAWGDQGTWTPHGRVLLQHRFNRHENEFMANLQGYPEGIFQVTGPNEGLNHAVVNAGLGARRGQHVAFTVDYVGDYAKRHRDQGVMLGASYRW